MNKFSSLILLFLIFIACNKTEKKENNFIIAFGSCNNQVLENTLWSEIEKNNPSVWVWGGDIIYSDTEDMAFMEQNYNLQKNDSSYSNFIKNIDALGTWDDHDYGVNDGGFEYSKKAESFRCS
jgi:alkaline phosphatase D